VAGAAHADAFIVGGAASLINCKTPINSAPTHYVAETALQDLDRWMRSGTPPPSAPRLQVSLVSGQPTVQRDALGNALGGLRTPALDVPVAAFSGVPGDPSNTLCLLFGSTHPFAPATLTRLYKSKDGYLAAYTGATDAAIKAGYLLPADRNKILAEASAVSF
jgi:hypothetical protein